MLRAMRRVLEMECFVTVRRILIKPREYLQVKPFLGETLVQAVSRSIADS